MVNGERILHSRGRGKLVMVILRNASVMPYIEKGVKRIGWVALERVKLMVLEPAIM